MTEQERKEVEKRAMELETIRRKYGGTLNPQDVVEFARDETTSLHSAFTWDDTEAAAQFRLWQARQVIRVCVTYSEELGEPIRTYVSLTNDRGEDGYRLLTDVIADVEMCQTLLQQALRDLESWTNKYSQLKKLEPIFKSAERVRNTLKKQKPRVKTAERANGKKTRTLAVTA